MDVYARLERMGVTLPPPPRPVANYATHAAAGRLLFLSGQGPMEADGRLHVGRVGADVSVDDARGHARITGINLIAVMHRATGDLNRVTGILRIFGMVNAVPDFLQHERVLAGCTELFAEVFGARGAVAMAGLGALPGQITVEIEAVAETAA